MTNAVDHDIMLYLPFDRYYAHRVADWLEQTGRTPMHIMLMEFDSEKYSYENIRHALISIAVNSHSPSHQVINEAIKAQAGITKVQTGQDVALRLETTHWSQEEPFKNATFWANWNAWRHPKVSIWFEFGHDGMTEKMYTAFLVETTWRVLEFSRMVTY